MRNEPGQLVELIRLIARCVHPAPIGGLKYSRSTLPPPGSGGTVQVWIKVGNSE
jgi:hypothetical protein